MPTLSKHLASWPHGISEQLIQSTSKWMSMMTDSDRGSDETSTSEHSMGGVDEEINRTNHFQTGFKPKFGIALGGGGARGWAHIGVLKALSDQGIEPDLIAGTSIGALVGGCYIAGKMDHLETFARSLSRRRVLSLLDITLGGSGLIRGQKLTRLMENQLKQIAIEDLRLPFICVATELGTGHEIWLRSGALVRAMRASYALPGIFEPLQIGGRWLLDGALVNPVPVNVCRAMGARVVLAINLNADILGQVSHFKHAAPPNATNALTSEDIEYSSGSKGGMFSSLRAQIFGDGDQIPGVTSVMVESFNIMLDRIARSRLAGDPPDHSINPKLGQVNLFDFHRADETIKIGYEAGIEAVDQIKELMTSLS